MASRDRESGRQYGGVLRDLDAAREHERPHLSRHAAEQYDDRTPPTAVAPEAALREAVPDETIVSHEHFDRRDQPDLDRVWAFVDDGEDGGEHYCAVFLEVGGCVLTAWTTETLYDRALADYLRRRATWGPR